MRYDPGRVSAIRTLLFNGMVLDAVELLSILAKDANVGTTATNALGSTGIPFVQIWRDWWCNVKADPAMVDGCLRIQHPVSPGPPTAVSLRDREGSTLRSEQAPVRGGVGGNLLVSAR
jgi:hypothetical protein